MLNSGSMVHGGCSMFLIDVYVSLLDVTAGVRSFVLSSLFRSCSSIALVSLGIATNRDTRLVSQAITTVFHAPATTCVVPVQLPAFCARVKHDLAYHHRGAKLRIINTTVSFGARTVTARTEVRHLADSHHRALTSLHRSGILQIVGWLRRACIIRCSRLRQSCNLEQVSI